MSAFQQTREDPWSPPPWSLPCLPPGRGSWAPAVGSCPATLDLHGRYLDWRDQSPWGFPPVPLPISAHASCLPSAWPSQRGPGLLEDRCGRDAGGPAWPPGWSLSWSPMRTPFTAFGVAPSPSLTSSVLAQTRRVCAQPGSEVWQFLRRNRPPRTDALGS